MFGTFAKAMMYMALGQAPGDVVFSNSRAQRMEARLPDESRRAEIREFLLFASQDQGATWGQVSKINANQDEFQFTMPVDGAYWLRVALNNRDGRQEPANLSAEPPNWKLTIDTLKPLVRLTSAARSGNEISVGWEIREDHPDWSTFRLEYLTAPNGVATPIAAAPGLTGQAKFNPTTNGVVIVRLTLRDKATNETVVTTEVANREGFAADGTPPLPQVVNGPASAVKPPDFSAAQAPPPLPPALPPTNISPLYESRIEIGGAPLEMTSVTIPGNPAAKSYPPAETKKTLPPPAPLMPVGGKSWSPHVTANYQTPTAPLPERREQPIASTAFPAPLEQVQYQAPVPPPINRKPLPPLQYVNSPEVVLEYELSKVGPSGVGSVDIYLTQDDGQNWDHVATDPMVIGKTTGGAHKGIVELPGDGVYGFSLVVKSQAQIKQELAAPEKKHKGPRPGDVPEIRVEVDTGMPTAELFPPRRDPAKSNSLLLVWNATDKNLGTNPVTLEWAERKEGPWLPIATNIPNSSKHSWQLPDRLPVQVYMRIRVKDLAGNEGVAVTPDPQLVDLSEPEGRLINVTVPPRR
jgi:hypothetical protein